MTRKKFKEFMTQLLELKQLEDDINEQFKKLDSDFTYFRLGRHEDLIVKILKEAMNDQYDWIGYWLYELNCGKLNNRLKITTKDGKNIPLKTIDDLYNLLTKNPSLI